MTIPSEPRTDSLYHARRDPALTPLDAVALLAIGMATFLVAGALVVPMAGVGIAALVAGELAVIGASLGGIRWRRLPLAALGLRRPELLDILAAILVGSTMWYVNLRLVDLLPLDEDAARPLMELVEGPHILLALLGLAVVPAIGEELMFRGVFARALATRLWPAVATVVSAAVFSLYHMSAVQLIPTFTLGLVLAAMTLRSRSTVTAMVAHAINNAMAVLVSRGALPGVTSVLEDHPDAGLVAAVIVTGGGIALLARRRR